MIRSDGSPTAVAAVAERVKQELAVVTFATLCNSGRNAGVGRLPYLTLTYLMCTPARVYLPTRSMVWQGWYNPTTRRVVGFPLVEAC